MLLMTAEPPQGLPASKPVFVLRPVPDEKEAKRLKKGKRFVGNETSAGWFVNGAIEATDAAIAVVDADGKRHEFPLSAGMRVEHCTRYIGEMTVNDTWLVNADNKIVVEFPKEGIPAHRYRDVAKAAGLPYQQDDYTQAGSRPEPTSLSLHKMSHWTAIKAHNDRVLHRWIHPFQRGPRLPKQD
jgi:hypothetical protein